MWLGHLRLEKLLSAFTFLPLGTLSVALTPYSCLSCLYNLLGLNRPIAYLRWDHRTWFKLLEPARRDPLYQMVWAGHWDRVQSSSCPWYLFSNWGPVQCWVAFKYANTPFLGILQKVGRDCSWGISVNGSWHISHCRCWIVSEELISPYWERLLAAVDKALLEKLA